MALLSVPPADWLYAGAALLAAAVLFEAVRRLLVLWLLPRVGDGGGFVDKRMCAYFSAVAVLVALLVLTEALPQLQLLALPWAQRALQVLLILVAGLLAHHSLGVLAVLYERLGFGDRAQVKGYLQLLKILLLAAVAIVVFAVLTAQPVLYYLSGLGAALAVVMLVFRETILAFVATLQIQAADMVRVGDWIEAREYDIDGEVLDVALHSIKVQNWDKTIATMPTSGILTTPLRNWRGMEQSGGRRIKRSIQIDMSSIRFLSPEEVKRFGKFELLDDYMAAKQKELEEHNRKQGKGSYKRRMTNIGTFRAYALAYLKTHPLLATDRMTCLVRQLPPSPQGLPLELYVFTATTDWAAYESIQADVFDHLLAILHEFDLRQYQRGLLEALAQQGVRLHSPPPSG